MDNNKKLEGVRYTAELRSLSKRVLALKHTDSNAADQVKSHLSADTLPLSSLKAMRTIIKQKCNESESVKTSFLADLNAALVAATKSSSTTDQTQARGGLQFTAPSTKPSPDQLTAEEVKYQRRIERLRLKAEENRYSRLVNNLDTKVADDETMKSMTYATSVGMNMIVAPISFGAFMYFFSGQLFGWVLDKDDDGASRNSNNNNVDIRAVIAGVISGVIMLFIEMTLFVIRSHEMDAAVSKKAKKRQVNPFGYDKRTAARTFEG